MSTTRITSPSHFQKTLDSSTYVVADFYADWCGPCKAIAPTFDALARSETKPGRIVFVKVDVDAQGEVSKKYGVTAMPTFIIFHNSTPRTTLRGADPQGLKSAILKASADAAKGPARESLAFSSKGHVLGSAPAPAADPDPKAAGAGAGGEKKPVTSTTTGNGGAAGSAGRVNLPAMPALPTVPGTAALGETVDHVVNFLGLYITSLFSLDPYEAARGSRWNLMGVR